VDLGFWHLGFDIGFLRVMECINRSIEELRRRL
jgi:hypothetical protein